jgi:uncharacterized repeat protein (TIGR02543 family)
MQAHTITFNWQEQYYLTVNSNYGATAGQGWYNAGANAQVTISTTTVAGATDTQYVFAGWSGDASDTATSSTIVMNGAKTATATWSTQYQVTFASNSSGTGTVTPNGDKWVTEGSLSISAVPNSNYTFVSWTTTGSITIASPSSNLTTASINGPGTIVANFAEQFSSSQTTIIATDTTNNATSPISIIGGNIAVTQFSNVTITPIQTQSVTLVNFTVTGESGTQGFGNMTLLKSAIPYGTTPLVYIDGVLAENQGFIEDANYYYVWFTTHFSTHEITIQFNAQTQITPTPTATVTPTQTVTPITAGPEHTLTLEYIIAIIVVVAVVCLFFFVILLRRKKRKENDA